MNEATCPCCDSDAAVFIGTLGSLDWFRCRDCGDDFSAARNDDEDDSDDDGRFSSDAEADEAQEWHDFDPDC